MAERVWIGLGVWMTLSAKQRADFGPHIAVDINDLSGWTQEAIILERERDGADAKRDGEDWAEEAKR